MMVKQRYEGFGPHCGEELVVYANATIPLITEKRKDVYIYIYIN